MYDHFSSIAYCGLTVFFTYSRWTKLRGYSKKLEISLCENNISKYFSSLVVEPWNNLHTDLIFIQNPELLKIIRHMHMNLFEFFTIPNTLNFFTYHNFVIFFVS